MFFEKYQQYYVLNKLPTISTKYVNELSNYTPYKNFSIFSHFGKQLKMYKSIDKTSIVPLINHLYMIDALSAINHVRSKLKLSFPNFIEDTKPIFKFTDSWNIHLDIKKTVKNNFDAKNTIITGPNAGGKSTFIKMVCTNILLAQTYCVCSASYVKMTPFYMLSSQINIPDNTGHESLFEAEMNRCLYNLKTIEKFKGYPCMVVMDEIFNSTNVIEAISGAYAILENIANNQNTLCIITTHLNYLTNLRKTSNFECYCMSVNIDDSIHYPYILKKGVSKQYIALELLKQKGFDKSIIDRALQIKSKFIK